MSELLEVQWASARVARGQIVGRSSRRHWTVTPNESDRTLCGRTIPWLRVHASNEGDCVVCLRVLRARAWEDREAREIVRLLGHGDASSSGPSG